MTPGSIATRGKGPVPLPFIGQEWYNFSMAARLSNIDEVRKALSESQGKPVEIEDDQTSTVYVMLTREEFQNRYQPMYDEDEPDPREFYGAFSAAAKDDIDAPGMEEYDDYDTSRTDA